MILMYLGPSMLTSSIKTLPYLAKDKCLLDMKRMEVQNLEMKSQPMHAHSTKASNINCFANLVGQMCITITQNKIIIT